MQKIKITQIRSAIGQTKRQKKILQALGLKKINHMVHHLLTPSVEGMLRKVNHLIISEKA